MNNINARDSAINPQLEQYRTHAHERGVQSIAPSNHFLVVDGLEYETLLGEKSRIPWNTDQTIFEERLGQIGTYYGNNEMLAFVDPDGRLQAGYSTAGNVATLEKAGYRRKSLHVPFSNGELPEDEDQKKQIIDLMLQGIETEEKEQRKKSLEGTTSVERARSKIKDLSQDDTDLVHSTPIENIFSLCTHGLLSHLFADTIGIDLPEFATPVAQKKAPDLWKEAPGKGLDYISVFDPKAYPANQTLDVIQKRSEADLGVDNLSPTVIALLISGRMRETAKFYKRSFLWKERFIRRRVPTKEFEGLVVDETILSRTSSWFLDWYRSSGRLKHAGLNNPRRLFLTNSSGDPELNKIKESFAKSELLLKGALLNCIKVLGHIPLHLYFGLSFIDHGNGNIEIGTGNLHLDDRYDMSRRREYLTEQYRKYDSGNLGKDVLQVFNRIFELQEARYQTEEILLERFIEKLTKKSIKEVTMEDILSGFCEQVGIPLYTREGKVRWPQKD